MTISVEFELSPNSRVTLHNNPNVAPGKCCMCGDAGGSDDRQFIDFGMQLDYYGSVYFCTNCFTEVSQSVGFVPMKALNALAGSNIIILKENDSLKERIEGLKDAAKLLFADCVCGDFGDGSSASHLDKSNQTAKESAGTDSVDDEFGSLKGLDSLYDSSSD